MRFRVVAVLVLACFGFVIAPAVALPAPAPPKALKAFKSDDELKHYLKRIARSLAAAKAKQAYPDALPPPPSPVNAVAAAPSSETVSVTGARASDSITNNQEQGVDEGDIVKASGDLLIVLRRGRLFTLSLAGGALQPVDMIDASAPGVDPSGDWYDEMLISHGRIVVIGYSYSRGGTQINRFTVTPDGHLSFEDAYALKSNDYYSSRNYASRLVGTRLIFYSPHYLPWGNEDLASVFPALRRWTTDGPKGEFRPIGTARNVFMSPGQNPEDVSAVHSVTSCDLMAPTLTCSAVSVLGPDGRVFYVSNTAVYVWVSPWSGYGRRTSSEMLYRLPLVGGTPQAVRAHGSPVDQFSFREKGQALDVLVRADSKGDAMWAPERSAGEIALVHVPFDAFNDGTGEIAHRLYRPLPHPGGNYYDFHNRFVGDYLLYGNGNGWGTPKEAPAELVVVPVKGGEPARLALPHGIDRIEVMGRDAVVVGSDGANLVFSAIALKPHQAPELGDRYTLAGAAQAETRSHGFFFKPEADPATNSFDGDYGVLGLPVSRPSAPAYRQLFTEAASVVFVRRKAGSFGLLGELASHPQDARDDACKASCVDWYGNARPIFYRGRTFALMGYEVVEGELYDHDMREKGRTNFGLNMPQAARQ
jgi:hypothetical protein